MRSDKKKTAFIFLFNLVPYEMPYKREKGIEKAAMDNEMVGGVVMKFKALLGSLHYSA